MEQLKQQPSTHVKSNSISGEHIVVDVTSDDGVFRSSHANKLIGSVPQKKVNTTKVKSVKPKVSNPLLSNLKCSTKKMFLPYTTNNLIKAYTKISKNSTNIGFGANSEMCLSGICVTNKSLFKKLNKKYKWNLEAIIDATVKDGSSADDEINTIKNFLDDIITSDTAIPKSLIHRLPKKLRGVATIHKNHPLDQLLDAIETLIKETDLEIIGSGAVSKGNRIAGIIDNLNTPIVELGLANNVNPMYDVVLKLLGLYKRAMALKWKLQRTIRRRKL